MRAALSALALLALPGLAAAGAPLSLVERQTITLDFTAPVQKLAVSDPEVVTLKAAGSSVKLSAVRSGRVQIEVVFADGATASFDVTIDPVRRAAVKPLAPDELELTVGTERVIDAPPGAQVLLEETGVVRAYQDGRGVVVQGVAPGAGSLVIVSPTGARTTWKLRVR